ncbi:hypothetical protein RHMOL_Rhmol11G0020500 [Rhododendron molle]|uniref:Uncharacterized protein n=1 Tax=Rhododendron molle TaxID=49168 RepID=A0ACC0LNU9_RHOML|nr:hypothetical protein RHMOL_Rhmol11G0020500 [Rhododendron molle]
MECPPYLRTSLALIRFEESLHLWTLVPAYQVKSPYGARTSCAYPHMMEIGWSVLLTLGLP